MNAARLAERLEKDQLRAEMLAVERLEEDGVNADRIEADELYASLLVADRVDADLLYAKQIAAARFEEDRRLVMDQEDRMLITSENQASKDLTEEMKLVFAECFEEKEGSRVKASTLLDVFTKSTTMTNFDKNVFTFRSRKLFLAQWTHTRLSKHRNENGFIDMAVKADSKRRHSQAAANKGGVDFIKKVKKVFAEKFEAKEGSRVLFNDLRGAVSSMSQVEDNLFQRHGGRLFLEQWPDASVSRVNCERCYGGVAVKSESRQALCIPVADDL
jgi:hypothetical protein